MKTSQRTQAYSKRPVLRYPSPALKTLPSANAYEETARRVSDRPRKRTSPTVFQATRNAGLMLYEILSMAELMRVAYEKGEMESLRNRLSLLISESTDLASSVSDILELTRLETDPAEAACERFDLVKLLHEVSGTARKIAGSKPVTVMDVSSPAPVLINSDPARIRRIMTCLMSNAAKFTERGRISMILAKDDDAVRLTVTDTGRGMTQEQISAVFESSERGYDVEMNGLETTGLGLKIVKALVKNLNGTISAASKPGEGTIVEVTLPVGIRAE